MDDKDTVATMMALGGISTIATVCRAIITPTHRSILGFLRALFLAMFVAIIVGLLLADSSMGIATKSGITGICAFVADFLLVGLINISAAIRDNAKGILKALLKRL